MLWSHEITLVCNNQIYFVLFFFFLTKNFYLYNGYVFYLFFIPFIPLRFVTSILRSIINIVSIIVIQPMFTVIFLHIDGKILFGSKRKTAHHVEVNVP